MLFNPRGHFYGAIGFPFLGRIEPKFLQRYPWLLSILTVFGRVPVLTGEKLSRVGLMGEKISGIDLIGEK